MACSPSTYGFSAVTALREPLEEEGTTTQCVHAISRTVVGAGRHTLLMLTEMLIFVGGALLGLLLHRNEIGVEARNKAIEAFIEFRVMVDLWPEDELPISQAPESDLDVRVRIERLGHWLTAVGIPESLTYKMCQSAHTVWRGHDDGSEIGWAEEYECGEDPNRRCLEMAISIVDVKLATLRRFQRGNFAIKRAMRDMPKLLEEMFVVKTPPDEEEDWDLDEEED